MTGMGLVLPFRRQAVRPRRVGLRRVATALLARWQQMRRRRETRRYVIAMDEHMLSDIGVSRAQALFEIDAGG